MLCGGSIPRRHAQPEGAIFCAIAVICDSLWALLAGAARSWLVSSPRRLSALGGTGGLVMAGLGAGLAVSGRPRD